MSHHPSPRFPTGKTFAGNEPNNFFGMGNDKRHSGHPWNAFQVWGSLNTGVLRCSKWRQKRACDFQSYLQTALAIFWGGFSGCLVMHHWKTSFIEREMMTNLQVNIGIWARTLSPILQHLKNTWTLQITRDSWCEAPQTTDVSAVGELVPITWGCAKGRGLKITWNNALTGSGAILLTVKLIIHVHMMRNIHA